MRLEVKHLMGRRIIKLMSRKFPILKSDNKWIYYSMFGIAVGMASSELYDDKSNPIRGFLLSILLQLQSQLPNHKPHNKNSLYGLHVLKKASCSFEVLELLAFDFISHRKCRTACNYNVWAHLYKTRPCIFMMLVSFMVALSLHCVHVKPVHGFQDNAFCSWLKEMSSSQPLRLVALPVCCCP